MVIQTRQPIVLNPKNNDALRDTIAALIREEMENIREEMRNVASTSIVGQGEYVRGWLFKCEQFFKVDGVAEDQNVNLISIHLYDIALMWHIQFVRLMGDTVPWGAYMQAILQRFGLAYDDPLAEIKKIKHAGLQNDVEVAVRIFKPRSLAELYGLAKLQEANLNALKRKHKIHILIDSGSAHNFLDSNTAKKLGCQLRSTYPLQVTMANGNNMMSSKMCRMKWSLQGEEFVVDMMILLLGGCEMVLDYNDVFVIPKELPPVRSHDHRIPLKEGSPRVNIRPYRHPATQKDAIENMVQELLMLV
ncbi:reverse transcriptase [Tanacetum coccineum]